MKLVFLGTSAAQPTAERGMTCICLVLDKEILMFDAGEGAQIAFQKAKLGWNKKTRIFVTHMHGDHCVGILGLLQTMSLQNRTESVDIYGPAGIEEFIAANLKILNFGLTFPVRIIRIKEGPVCDDSGYTVHVCEAEHSIPAYSYLFTEKDRPGKFYPEKAKALGIPEGKLWHDLPIDAPGRGFGGPPGPDFSLELEGGSHVTDEDLNRVPHPRRNRGADRSVSQ